MPFYDRHFGKEMKRAFLERIEVCIVRVTFTNISHLL